MVTEKSENILEVPISGELDEAKKQHLLDFFKIVEAAYDERTIEKHEKSGQMSFTFTIHQSDKERLKDVFSLALAIHA